MPKQSTQKTIRSTTNTTRQRSKVTYAPPSALHYPEELVDHFARQGYKLRWNRIMINGREDYKNIARKRKEHYTFVQKSEIPQEILDTMAVDSPIGGSQEGLLIVGDVALSKIPIEYNEARKDYYDDVTRKQSDAIRALLGQESRRGTRHMPIEDDSETVVTQGRKPAGFGQTNTDT